jgi:hypothetical protein
VTHGPRGNIVDLYTTLPWELLCDQVGKLRIDVRAGTGSAKSGSSAARTNK